MVTRNAPSHLGDPPACRPFLMRHPPCRVPLPNHVRLALLPLAGLNQNCRSLLVIQRLQRQTTAQGLRTLTQCCGSPPFLAFYSQHLLTRFSHHFAPLAWIIMEHRRPCVDAYHVRHALFQLNVRHTSEDIILPSIPPYTSQVDIRNTTSTLPTDHQPSVSSLNTSPINNQPPICGLPGIRISVLP